MKLTEILKESDNMVEAPLGMIKRAGLGLASKFSSKAAGRLATGNEANEIRKDYDFFLGSTNQKSTADTLMQFLQKEKYPVDFAQKAINQVPGIKQNPQIPLPKNVADQIFNNIAAGQTSNLGSKGTGQAAQPTTAPTATPAQAATPANIDIKQLKTTVSKMRRQDKQELIDYLKQNDRLKELKF